LHEDPLRFALTNRQPDLAADEVLADIAELEPGAGYPRGGLLAGLIDEEQRDGFYTLALQGPTFQAQGGVIGPFQYVVLYNGTIRVAVHPLIARWTYGVPITLRAGEELAVTLPRAGVVIIGGGLVL
jgi:hypothetical protein